MAFTVAFTVAVVAACPSQLLYEAVILNFGSNYGKAKVQNEQKRTNGAKLAGYSQYRIQ